ncbi:hypothetical protein DdX_17676 [Ditylenchus destructor]|uniref:Uncharacterized protein n=1 Tax=Ditylenchus destructor TaxID=166010 RepID=A0AAD4MN09_9BILA|nr:hypothetical protein DdX_17676 [Ditylenchus destructor]
MSTTTRPYFEIRSEHYYRYALSYATYQAIKQHKPYTYVIVPVMNSRNETDEFKTAQETIECYAALHKYSYRVLYADGTDEHSRHLCTQKDIMYRRHCVFAQFMKSNPNYEWYLFLDADIGVINPDHRLEDFTSNFILQNSSIYYMDLIFYNRIFLFEIAAGSYFARNTKFAYDFLMEWSNYLDRFPGSFIGSDNGILHLLLMERLGTKVMLTKCLSFLEASKGFEDLFNFEACTRHLLLKMDDTMIFHTESGTIKVLGKGKSWVRDGGELLTSSRWSDNDFMLHGWKRSKLYEIGPGKDAWINPFLNKELRMDLCNGTVEDALSNWKYRKFLRLNNKDIEIMIQRVIDKVKARFDDIIKELKL